MEFTRRGIKVQSLPRALVELPSHLVEVGLGVDGQISFLREVLSQQTVGVFVGAALPGALRITEVDVDLGGDGEVFCDWPAQTSIPGQGASERRGEFTNLPTQRSNDGRGVFAGHLDQDDETRMPFDQGCDVSVLAACEQDPPPNDRGWRGLQSPLASRGWRWHRRSDPGSAL